MLHIEAIRHQRGIGNDSFTLQIPRLIVDRGETVAVTGASGSGKSTLLEIIGLILKPDEAAGYGLGPAENRQDIAALWRRNQSERLAKIRAVSLGFVVQSGGLLPYLTVLENIVISRRLLGLPAPGRLVEKVCKILGLEKLLNRKPAQLSIGERQRAAIARALAHEPMLLLADEPTAALDPIHAGRVLALLLELACRFDLTSIIVTHDWSRVRELGLREIQASCTAEKFGTASTFQG
ncbi:MAG: ABC transporter ATP-binding protein [Methylococcales bacterium]